MFSLLSLTFVTSFTDSFNPFGILQQFTLQGILKKNRHIWYYIWAMFATNFAAGVLFYWGMATLSDQVLNEYGTMLQTPLAVAVFLTGLGMAWYSVHSFLNNWKMRRKLSTVAGKEAEELAAKLSARELTPASLFSLGVMTTMMELTTAAPYLAYLTLVQQYRPTTVQFLVLLFLYNLIYCGPLFVLYFLSVFFQDTFERIYHRINTALQFVSAFLVPALLLLIALLLIGLAGSSFFR